MIYHYNNANERLEQYDGQTVEYLGKALGQDVPGIPKSDQLHNVRFQDGTEGTVFADELINPGKEGP
jgi:hypothetical protein